MITYIVLLIKKTRESFLFENHLNLYPSYIIS